VAPWPFGNDTIGWAFLFKVNDHRTICPHHSRRLGPKRYTLLV
jgi:hypothetical protein